MADRAAGWTAEATAPNEIELWARVARISSDLQEVTDYLQANPRANRQLAQIRFPRGYLRTAHDHRTRLNFINDANLKANVSYALMTHDALRWLVFNTDIFGQARGMLVKEGVCTVASICESITIDPNAHGLGRNTAFVARVARLVEMNVIAAETGYELNWLWEIRRAEHLYDLTLREWEQYKDEQWTRAVSAYHSLRDGLTAWALAGRPRRGLPIE